MRADAGGSGGINPEAADHADLQWVQLGCLLRRRLPLAGGNRNTLKQHFRALVESGALSQQGAGRGVWYQLK